MWLKTELRFTDGLLLPVGCRVVPFVEGVGRGFEPGDIDAATDCAERLRRESGAKPLVCSINGALRVIDRRSLTDIKPATETAARLVSPCGGVLATKIGGADDRAIA